RSAKLDDKIHFDFHAYGRDFKLSLERVPVHESSFLASATVEFDDETTVVERAADVYKGTVEGESSSHVFGSIHDGIFEGMVRISEDKVFWIESSFRYNSTAPFHSFIYAREEVEMPPNEEEHKEKRSPGAEARRYESPDYRYRGNSHYLPFGNEEHQYQPFNQDDG
ncbi:hypothetical protein PFISCL1PPCAC_22110, partial [Pristionchus fissidentatus]